MKLIIYNSLDAGNFTDIVSEPSNKAAIANYRHTVAQIENEYQSGKASLKLLSEDYATFHFGYFFYNFSPFYEIFNEVQGWLESNGFMENRRNNMKMTSKKAEEIGPQVLTMDHLTVGFLACLIPMVLSLAAFIIEFISHFFLNLISKFHVRSDVPHKGHQSVENLSRVDKNDIDVIDIEELEEIV